VRVAEGAVSLVFIHGRSYFPAMELNEQPAPYMGEVRVKVRITNSADAQAAKAGKLPLEKVRSVEANALVDTGAVRSCIPAPLIEMLGVVPFETSLVEYADGRKEPVGLVDGLRFEVMNRRSGDEALILGDEVLIGQTLLEKMDLLVDCPRHRLVPNPAHPDVAVSKVK
jgi:predicted aspartyl protease